MTVFLVLKRTQIQVSSVGPTDQREWPVLTANLVTWKARVGARPIITLCPSQGPPVQDRGQEVAVPDRIPRLSPASTRKSPWLGAPGQPIRPQGGRRLPCVIMRRLSFLALDSVLLEGPPRLTQPPMPPEALTEACRCPGPLPTGTGSSLKLTVALGGGES